MVTSPVHITLLAGKARTSNYVGIAQMTIHYNSLLLSPTNLTHPGPQSRHRNTLKEGRKWGRGILKGGMLLIKDTTTELRIMQSEREEGRAALCSNPSLSSTDRFFSFDSSPLLVHFIRREASGIRKQAVSPPHSFAWDFSWGGRFCSGWSDSWYGLT